MIPVEVENPSEEGPDDENKVRLRRRQVSKDDGITHNANVESMAKFKPVSKADDCSVAGNGSQISDGAAAVLMTRRSTATSLILITGIISK